MRIRDGSHVADVRCDSITEFDLKSRDYPITANFNTEKIQTRMWECPVSLDQGREGACVGFALSHALLSQPIMADPIVVDGEYARNQIYYVAQKMDRWPGGAYPGASPRYEGTSLLAGIRVLKKMGWIKEYRWAFSLEELVLGIAHSGPAVVSIPWYDSMYRPSIFGNIYPRGRLTGRHCILVRGVDIKRKMFTMRNSWGNSWGDHGDCNISYKDMEWLLGNQGQIVFLSGRRNILR